MKSHRALVLLLWFFFLTATGWTQSAPTITAISSPRQVVVYGQSLTLSVTASGSAALSFQWKHNGRIVAGANSPSYLITSAKTARDDGWYQVLVTEGGATTVSPVIFVNVVVTSAQVIASGGFGTKPTDVPADLSNVVSVAAGYAHWLVLKADGTVAAGGENRVGQCDIPTGLSNVVVIAAGNYSSYALRADGTVATWGATSKEQDALIPTLTNLVSISAGQSHALGLRSDGTVVTWGWFAIPTVPADLNGVIGISAGENNSVAWRADGSAVGWGENAFGQTSVPNDLMRIVDIASGEDFAIGLRMDGTVVGWGRSYSHGEVVPVGLKDVVGISAGIYDAFAVKADGSVVAWGSKYTGYTGAVTPPPGATEVVMLAAKDAYTVVLRRFSNQTATTTDISQQSYTFTPLSGQAGIAGSADGVGAAARFKNPVGLAVDHDGNVFVADSGNSTLRKITPSGVTTTIAGLAGTVGFFDGTADVARLYRPTSVGLDRAGNLYVADAGMGTVRKVTTAGLVSTLAGAAAQLGSADGVGSKARFAVPNGLAVDAAGNVYVSDCDYGALADLEGNGTIRKITPEGVVTTLAGSAGQYGNVDGIGPAARFNVGYLYAGVGLDNFGNLLVADTGNRVIRKVTADGVVSTLTPAGVSPASGPLGVPRDVAVDRQGNIWVTTDSGRILTISINGVTSAVTDSNGNVVRFGYSAGIAVDDFGNLYVSDSQNHVIYKGVSDLLPVIVEQPTSQSASLGGLILLTVRTSGAAGRTFQWLKDGAKLENQTNSTLTLAGLNAAMTGVYACVVTNTFGTVQSQPATVSIYAGSDVGHLVNFSVLNALGSGSGTFNLGFSLAGPANAPAMGLLLRAVGPSLSALKISGAAVDPQLALYANGTKLAENDNWNGDGQVATAAVNVGAFPLVGPTSLDAALYQPALPPGVYTAVLSGAAGTKGSVLGEIYSAMSSQPFGPATPRLVNFSARAQIIRGDVMTVGFVIVGQTSKSILVRGVGPSLAQLGITDLISNPLLRLFSGSSLLRENDDWNSNTDASAESFARVGAFALPAGSSDSALLVTLQPGAYTAQVTDVGGTGGNALIEVYEMPDSPK